MLNPAEIQDRLDHILLTVQKPGRYTGGELNQVVKDWSADRVKFALVFPDIYDLGMSNLGLAILYDTLNQRHDVLAERVFAPWPDMEAAMRENSIPLYSLETKHPLAAFDIIGFSIPYETLYTNTLNMLNLAGLLVLSRKRSEEHPLVIAGGHATFNPEPLHAFIDAFVIGEGEEVIHEIVDVYQSWQRGQGTRQELLLALAQLWGVYVPSLYRAHYHPDGTFSHLEKQVDQAPLPILKRMVAKLPPLPTRLIVPFVETNANRAPVEIMRGCTHGCRFCQAGMITRPVRERSVDEVLTAIEQLMKHTGFEEVGLLSLSSSDYTHILELVQAIGNCFGDQKLSISLPSLRIESFSVELMDALQESRRRGFTLAPEAATEHMREIINKPVSTEQLLETARQVYQRGWTTIKLYFMIGHPSETLDDVRAIAKLCKAVLAEGLKIIGGRAKVHAGVSTFVPKPHTPFQWVSCDTIDQIRKKQTLLRRELRGSGFKLKWTEPEETMLEAWLARGDRRMAEVVFQAWKRGAKFDAWQDYFAYDTWMEAFSSIGLDPNFYTHRPRALDEAFPWDHIDSALRKEFLRQDYLWSLKGKTRADCRGKCYACGILPTFTKMRREHPGEGWLCPEAKQPAETSAERLATT